MLSLLTSGTKYENFIQSTVSCLGILHSTCTSIEISHLKLSFTPSPSWAYFWSFIFLCFSSIAPECSWAASWQLGPRLQEGTFVWQLPLALPRRLFPPWLPPWAISTLARCQETYQGCCWGRWFTRRRSAKPPRERRKENMCGLCHLHLGREEWM